MKSFISSIAMMFLMLTLIACKSDTDPDPAASTDPDSENLPSDNLKSQLCKNGLITGSYLDQYDANGILVKFHTLYEYKFDSEDRISQITQRYVGDYLKGIIKSYRFIYNDQGYLISKTCDLNHTTLPVGGGHNTTDEHYEYSSGRLTKIISETRYHTTNGVTSTNESSVIYQYDAQGRIISDGRYRFGYSADNTIVSFGHLSGPESFIVTDGRISSSQSGNQNEVRFSYNEEGNLFKEEFWEEGKIAYTRQFLWDSKKAPISILGNFFSYNTTIGHDDILSLSKSIYHLYFKGWPELPKPLGKQGNNLLRINDISHVGGPSPFQSYTNELNYSLSGFPISGESMIRVPFTGSLNVYNLISFEYCN